MRISVDKDDAAYDYGFASMVYQIIFDGEVITDCITADDVKGEVLRYVTSIPGAPEAEWFDGDVKIIMKTGE